MKELFFIIIIIIIIIIMLKSSEPMTSQDHTCPPGCQLRNDCPEKNPLQYPI